MQTCFIIKNTFLLNYIFTTRRKIFKRFPLNQVMPGARPLARQLTQINMARRATNVSRSFQDIEGRHHQTFELPDGRSLGFAEYGVPNGKPVLYFHGFPSSRLEAGPVDAIAQRLGVRILALDRPGFGLSSPLPQSQLLDWPTDVQAFASGIGLSRFAVFGLSGGGPFALACAKVLPQEMLSGVGLFASAPHWAAGRHYMTIFRRALSWTARHWPGTLRVVADMCINVVNWIISTGPVTRRIDTWLSQQKPGLDGPVRTVAEQRESLLAFLFKEPFAQGSGAAVNEIVLLSSDDWGFRLENVDYDTVRIWHGVDDKNSPIVMMRYMAEKLPHCKLYELEGETHYSMFKHLEDALATLVQED